MKTCIICSKEYEGHGNSTLCSTKCRKANRKRYKQRPEVVEKQREYQREYQQRPEVKEKRRKYQREYQKRPKVREYFRNYMREYYHRKKNEQV